MPMTSYAVPFSRPVMMSWRGSRTLKPAKSMSCAQKWSRPLGRQQTLREWGEQRLG